LEVILKEGDPIFSGQKTCSIGNLPLTLKMVLRRQYHILLSNSRHGNKAAFMNPKERTRFLKFAIVGTFGAVVDFGIMNLLTSLFSFELVVAGIISFIAAITNNFLWNRYWTYPDSRSKPILWQLISFSIVSITGLIIRIPILKFLEPQIQKILTHLNLNLLEIPIHTISANLSLTIAIVIVLFWNFFINRYWTYNDVG
jgi:putative flippase GtrA